MLAVDLCLVWGGERDEEWCICGNLGTWLHFSAPHIVLVCVTVSQIWSDLPDLSSQYQKDHYTFTTSKQFTSPKLTVDTFEGWVISWWSSEWDQTDRFIYREMEKEREIGLACGPNMQSKEEWSSLYNTLWALSAFYSSPPPDLSVQFKCNLFTWFQKETETQDSLSLRIQGFLVESERMRDFASLNP